MAQTVQSYSPEADRGEETFPVHSSQFKYNREYQTPITCMSPLGGILLDYPATQTSLAGLCGSRIYSSAALQNFPLSSVTLTVLISPSRVSK